MDNEIKFQDISKIERVSKDFSRFGDDYIFARVTQHTLPHTLLQQGFRYEGLMLVLVKSGELKVGLNMEPKTLSARSLLFTSQRTVINIDEVDWDTLDAYVLILSTEFMRNVTMDLNTVAATVTPFAAEQNHRHSMELSEGEFEMMSRYFELFHLNVINNSNEIYMRSIARSLTAAIFYQLMHIGKSRVSETAKPHAMSRRVNYVQAFVGMVHQYFRRERSIGFYADKLFISPKYLSLIVKETTGRSAADWIDECVILEAKNLLKYSGKNVQQVAYELGFANQSSFGKYFKHLTGMSPTKFLQS